jgi:hypothetical protein
MRLVLTLAVTWLFLNPGLELLGAILLAWSAGPDHFGRHHLDWQQPDRGDHEPLPLDCLPGQSDPRPDHGPEMVHDLGNIVSELEGSSHGPLPQWAIGPSGCSSCRLPDLGPVAAETPADHDDQLEPCRFAC